MKLSEWKLRINENVDSTLAKLRAAADKTSAAMNKLQDKVSGVGSRVSDGFTNMRMKLSDLNDRFGDAMSTIPGVGSALTAFINPVTASIAAIGLLTVALAGSLNAAVEFQTKLSEFSAITGTTGDGLLYVHDKAIELSNQTNQTAVDIVEAYKLVASNVPPALQQSADAIDQLTQASITLQTGNPGLILSDAVNATVGTMNQFNLTIAESDRIINALAAGSQKGNAEVPDLAMSMKEVGATAAAANLSLEQTVGAIETLGVNMEKGSQAGTSLRNILLILQSGEIPGLNLKADGLAATLEKLSGRVEDTAYMTKIFGRENVNSAQFLINNIDKLKELTGLVTDSNAAYEMAAVIQGSYAYRMQMLQNRITNLRVEIGERLLPYAEKFVNWLIKAFDWIKNEGTPILDYFRATLEMVSIPLKLIWQFLTDISDALASVGIGAGDLGENLWDIFSIVATVFKGVADIVYTTMSSVARMMNPINWFKKGFWSETWNNLKGTFSDFGSDFGDAWSKAFSESAADGISAAADKINSMKGMPQVGEGMGPFLPTEPKKAPGNEDLKKGLEGVNGGGRQIKNITVNIGKLVESVNINSTTVKESAGDLQRIIEEAVMRAIQGGEIAASNN